MMEKKVKVLTELDARLQDALDAVAAVVKVSGEPPVKIMDALGDLIDVAEGYCDALSSKIAREEAGR
jgi:hypothetical protein